MKTRTIIALGIFCFVAVSLFVALIYHSTHHDMNSVSLRLQWVHQAQFAGFYVAKEKGFYKNERLDVTIEPGGEGFNVPLMVSTYRDDIGIWEGDQVVKAYAVKDMPIRAIGVVFRTSLVCYLVKDNSQIFTPGDFRGKVVGVYPGYASESIYIDALRKFGVDRSSIHEFPAAYDLTPFLTGRVDVWPSYRINEPLTAKERNIPARCLGPDEWGIHYYSDTLIVREDALIKKRDVFVRFLRASQLGWRYALAHPEEAVQIVLKYDPSANVEHQRAMLKALAEYTNPEDPFFQIDPNVWNSMVSSLHDQGVLEDVQAVKARSAPDYTIAQETR
jgi:NitT/TauT family transport system substrate-binding protein